MVTFHLAYGCCGFHLAHSLALPKVPDFHFITSAEKYVELFVKVHAVDETVSVERGHEFSLFQGDTINFIGGGTDAEVGIYRIEHKVSREVRYSGFIMRPILSMYLNASVDLGHSNFAIVISQHSKLNNLTVKASQAFQTELSRIEYFNLWTVDA